MGITITKKEAKFMNPNRIYVKDVTFGILEEEVGNTESLESPPFISGSTTSLLCLSSVEMLQRSRQPRSMAD